MIANVGRVGRYTTPAIAERAVDIVLTRTRPVAVCVDPDGRVTVESLAEAVDEDIVGVYAPATGFTALYRSIRDDLALTVEQRGITGEQVRERNLVRDRVRA